MEELPSIQGSMEQRLGLKAIAQGLHFRGAEGVSVHNAASGSIKNGSLQARARDRCLPGVGAAAQQARRCFEWSRGSPEPRYGRPHSIAAREALGARPDSLAPAARKTQISCNSDVQNCCSHRRQRRARLLHRLDPGSCDAPRSRTVRLAQRWLVPCPWHEIRLRLSLWPTVSPIWHNGGLAPLYRP